MKKYIINNKSSLIFVIIIFLFVFGVIIIDDREFGYNHTEKVFDANSIVSTYVSEEEMAKKYFADYVNLSLTDPKFAYELLNYDYKTIKYPTYDFYVSYLKNVKYGSFKSYAVGKKDNMKAFYVKDSLDNEFIFKENGVMDYSVYLDNSTI